MAIDACATPPLGSTGGEAAFVASVAERSGLDGERARAAVEAPEIKQRLRAATDEALRRGVTGVPTVAVGDELYWGDDRLEDAAHAAAA